MTTIQELKNAIKQAEETLEELYENIEEMKNRLEEMELGEKWGQEQKTIYNLEIGDVYYCLSTYGDICEGAWGNCELDRCLLNMGNIFLTYEDAEDELRARKLIAKARESQKGFVPKLLDDEDRYYLNYGVQDGYIYGPITNMYNNGPILGYWDNEDDMNNFKKENIDELTWFFKEYKGW